MGWLFWGGVIAFILYYMVIQPVNEGNEIKRKKKEEEEKQRQRAEEQRRKDEIQKKQEEEQRNANDKKSNLIINCPTCKGTGKASLHYKHIDVFNDPTASRTDPELYVSILTDI